MTDTPPFELEDDPRPARLARRQRLAMRGVALAVPILLVTGLLAAVAQDDERRDESRVATAGTGAPLEPEELVIEVPSTVTTVLPLPVDVPKVTVPKPKLPRLPALTVPPAPLTIPPVPVCPATPPPVAPPDQLGLYEIPAAGGAARLVLPTTEPTFVQDFTYSPDGARIAFVRGSRANDGQDPWKILVSDANFGNEREVVTGNAHLLEWSPDGRYIAFFAQAPGDVHSLHLLDPSTGAVRQVSKGDVNGVGPAVWSSDGTRLAWSSSHDGGVWVTEAAAGSPVVKVADDKVVELDWSPDGRQLVLGRVGGGVFVFDRDGSNRRKLRDDGIRVAWSPTDRSRLVVDIGGALYRVDPDSGASTFLAVGSAYRWLRDGSRVLAGSVEGLHLVGWDGCRQTLVSGDGLHIAVRAATPDGKTILFARHEAGPPLTSGS